MLPRDFFAYCTSLQPLELKALGALSHVRHLPEGEIIYRTGESADALYIINRGTVRMSRSAGSAQDEIILSRGDLFGDLEVLTATPRRHQAEAIAAVSAQCFERSAFPALLRGVPSFFRYLSERLAVRLLERAETAAAERETLELRGSLGQFDAVTIYQMIVNSSQTGDLRIANTSGEAIGAFAFETGEPRSARFGHLGGEEAFTQLFLAEELRGTFSFATRQPADDDSTESCIHRHPGELLLCAMQSRDEFQAFRRSMGESAATLEARQAELNTHEIAPSARLLAEQIWQLTAAAPASLGELFQQLPVSELKVYRAVNELVRTGHSALSSSARPEKVA